MRFKDMTEKDIKAFSKIYKNKDLSWDERMKRLMKLTGKSERTVRVWASKKLNLNEKQETLSVEYEQAKNRKFDKKKKKFIITWAQNNTPVHKEFFENLTANRSYVVHAIDGNKNQLKSMAALTELKKSFSEYIENLNIQTIDFKEERLEKLQLRSLKESAWLQLLVTMKFWLDDTSSSFEKTDIFIEKSVKASFDLIDTTPLKSIIDFGKFLFKEKIQNN